MIDLPPEIQAVFDIAKLALWIRVVAHEYTKMESACTRCRAEDIGPCVEHAPTLEQLTTLQSELERKCDEVIKSKIFPRTEQLTKS